MGEIASAHVSIYPKFAPNFGKDITSQVGAVGQTAGVKMGTEIGTGVAKSAPKIGQGISTAVAPILALASIGAVSSFVSSSVASFAELEDATAAAGVVFGDSMGTITEQANGAATAIGISKTEATNAAITFGTFGKSAGLAGKDLAGFSTEMVQLAGDMASFRGTSPEQAIEAIGSAMRGEAEPIRQYGVLLDDASLKNRALAMGLITTTKDALSPQNKVLAAQAEILAQTSDAQGDFARTSQSTANTQKILAAESANLSAEIGQKLAPAIVEAQKAGIGFLKWTSDNLAVLAPMAGAVGTVALAVGGFVLAAKGIEAVKAARATIAGLGEAFSAMGTKAKAATLATGYIGAALVVAGAVYGLFASAQERAAVAVEDYTTAIKLDTGALGENTRAAIANRLEKDGALVAAQKLGISLDVVTDAVLGNKLAMDQVLSVTGPMGDSFSDMSAAAQDRAQAANDLEKALGFEAGKVVEGKAAYDRLTDAQKVSTSATSDGTGAIDANAAALQKQLDAINASAQAQLALSGSQIGLEAAIDSATAAVKKNGQTLDIHTEKGRANRSALNNIAAAGLSVVDSMKKTGASSDAVSKRMDSSRAAFIKVAQSMGLSKDEAKALADKLGLIKSKTVTIKVNFTQAQQAAFVVKYNLQRVGGPKLAAGGPVIGPGSATSDSIPAMLSNGEHVLTASEVSRMGGHQAVYRMRAAARAGGLRFAGGGAVGGSPQDVATFGPSATDIAVAVASAMNGMTLQLTGANHLSDSLSARVVAASRRI